MLIDSHAHLDFPTSSRKAGLRGTSIDDLDKVLARTKAAGVDKIITIGTSVECSKRCIELAEKYSSKNLQVYATVGLHPRDAKEEIERFGLLSCFKTGKQLAQSSKKIVAIGECGLDYYLVDREKSLETGEEEKEFQRELFAAQIKLAADLDLPLVVHCRNGWDEIFDLILKIKNQKSTIRGVFHSWTGDWDAAKKALDLGFYISFSGIVTFENASDIKEVAKKTPIERILVETDSPFLAPEPLRSTQGKLGRGKTNSPENVKIVAEFLASIRSQSLDIIIKQTSDNATRLFNLS